jgi:threonine/homoserine/homoserine lactone efflux protein
LLPIILAFNIHVHKRKELNLPETEFSLLMTGIIFGLSGGLTPGPLFTFIISETLKYGMREGIKIALVPLLSDLPIVVLALFVVSGLSGLDTVIGLISFCGALYLIYLAVEGIRFKGTSADVIAVKPKSVRKGITINLLNPNPYIFWFTIGAPTVISGAEISTIAPVAFIAGMYLFLVGSKIILAVLVGKSRHILKSRIYIYTIRILGFVLLVFAVVFLQKAGVAFGL